jgi:trafficking protein particle complex subunit 9
MDIHLYFYKVQALESPLGNEYLNSSLMPLLPPLSDLPSPLNSLSKNEESPPSLASRSSQPDISRPFTLNAVPTLKRHSSTTTTNTRQPNLAVQTQKKRLSTIGISSSHGRLYKTLGDFFLLAGRTDDAMIWCVQL